MIAVAYSPTVSMLLSGLSFIRSKIALANLAITYPSTITSTITLIALSAVSIISLAMLKQRRLNRTARYKNLTLYANCGNMYRSLEKVSGLKYLLKGYQPDCLKTE